jgi:4a-hydroxytetrahydrobiopterin dehydratase
MTIASEQQLEEALARLPGWRRDGDSLVRELRFRDFDDAMLFAGRVGACAVDYRRRPDMCISEYNHVRLSVTNLHHAGFTVAELRLLEKVSAILDEHHPDVVARS